MSTPRFAVRAVAACCFLSLLSVGCGQSGGSSGDQAATGDKSNGQTAALPVASISSPPTEAKPVGPDKGTAAWLLREIIKLRTTPLPATTTPAEREQAQQQRDKKIVEMATEAVAKSHSDPKQKAVFNAAVHHLVEARLQLALRGDQQSIDLLYDDADSLYRREPESKAAAEAAYALARFAHTNAQRFGKREPRWIQEFAHQARYFARNFPKEDSRAATLLYAAGWSCELNHLIDEAIGCYTVIKEKFPKSGQARQVTAVLRRLNLSGGSLQLAGPTIDGGFTSIDQFQGKVVLIVFWSSDTARFVKQTPLLIAASKKFGKAGFEILGINLDEEEAAVDAFLEKHPLPGQQIFYSEPEKRRWDNPIVQYYGIRNIPAYWLVDRQGIVRDVFVNPADLDKRLPALLKAAPLSKKSPKTTKKK